MSRVAIITVAGISSRFNKDVDDEHKVLKCIYTEADEKSTLLYQMIEKLSYADEIVVVGGYRYDDLSEYIKMSIPTDVRQRIRMVYNEHFKDLSSGYSLYLGIKEAIEGEGNISDILFVEGDLDIDRESLEGVIASDSSVLTYSYEPIKADKAVVLFVDGDGRYNYAFNSAHGLLSINTPFSAIYNSGQTWKFTDMDSLKTANEKFVSEYRDGTNLVIIQEYLNRISADSVEVFPLNRWTNCNTRDDYRVIKERWDDENA